MSKKIYLAASVCAASLMVASAANAVNVVDIYGTYSDTINPVTGGTGPSIDTTGALNPGNAGTHTYFNVDNLSDGGPAGVATTGGPSGLLFTVDPGANSSNATVVADINVTFDFYSSTNTLLGTLSDTAFTTFNYSAQDDIICWQNSKVGTSGANVSLVSSSAAGGSCDYTKPGSGTTGYEKITVDINGSTYIIDLTDWSDWDEQPDVTWQLVCNTNCGGGTNGGPVPEPLTLSLFGAGLAGAAFIRRRKKKAA